jgi:hypothetical protein
MRRIIEEVIKINLQINKRVEQQNSISINCEIINKPKDYSISIRVELDKTPDDFDYKNDISSEMLSWTKQAIETLGGKLSINTKDTNKNKLETIINIPIIEPIISNK